HTRDLPSYPTRRSSDLTEPARISATQPDGTRYDLALEVQPRQWRIERVDGLPPQTVTPDPDVAARIAREQAMVNKARTRNDARRDRKSTRLNSSHVKIS